MLRKFRGLYKHGFIGYMQRILTLVVVTMIVSFIINLFIKPDFKTVLKFASFAVLLIGLLSALGGSRTMHDSRYIALKGFTETTNVAKEDINLLHGSQAFLIFMTISGIILYGVHLLF